MFRRKPSFRLLHIHLAFGAGRGRLQAASGQWGEPSGRADIQAPVRLLEAYFDGRPIQTPWEWLDLDAFTPLERAVFQETARIPFGECRTYQGIARAVGRDKACRFVGNTLGKNPFPLLVPCHRVIRSDGSLGGFGGGLEIKEALLALESRLSRA